MRAFLTGLGKDRDLTTNGVIMEHTQGAEPDVQILGADDTHTVAFALQVAIERYRVNRTVMTGLGQTRLAAQFERQIADAERLRALIANADALAVHVPAGEVACA